MNIRPVVYIVPLLILAAAIVAESNLLLRVVIVLVAVGLAAFIWTALGLRGLRLNPGELPNHCQAGSHFKQDFTVVNDSRIPKMLLRAEEQSNLPGYSNAHMLNIPSGASQSWQSTVTCRRRGRYNLGSLRVTSGDPFGLFSRTRRIGKPRDIIVYPRVVELPFFGTSFSQLLDFGQLARGRRISQISPSASSVREMVSGDSHEHIHWRSTARAGKLMVKVFDAEHSSDITKSAWIILDMHQSAHFGEGDETTEEYAVSAAASLTKKYLDDGIRVGLVASAEQSYSFLPDGGEAHFVKILEALALMKATGKVPIERLLSDTGRFDSNSTIVIITPQSTEPVMSAIHRLRNYGHSVVTVFLDSSTFGGPLSPTHMAHSLGSMGVQVYIISRGDDLAKAFDSRLALWYSRFV